MKVLIYDSQKSIHLPEYVEHICRHIVDKVENGNRFFFLLQKDIYNLSLERLSRNGLVTTEKKFQIVTLDQTFEQRLLATRSVLKRTMLELDFISKFCDKYDVEKVIFLNIDIFLVALGLKGLESKKKILVDGILFSPYTVYPKTFFIQRLKKYLQTSFLLLNQNIKNVYILNDCESPFFLNKTHRTTVFSYLPDPVNNEDSVTSLGASVTLKKDTKKLNLLISGRISSRKNVHNIIKATQMLPKEISQKIILVIAGEFSDKEYESRVLSLVAEAKNVNVVIENKLFSDKELLDVLKKSDVVFVAYSNFFASSGILGHAVNFSKVVIGATNGVIGKTIRKYNLGALVDPESPLSIKRAVIEVANRHNFIKENALFEQYKNDHSPELFSKTLFESI